MRYLAIIALGTLLSACTSHPTKELKKFNPDQPVEIRRGIFGAEIFQRGEHFYYSELKDYYSENKVVQDKFSKGKMYTFAGMALYGIAGALFVTGENTKDVLVSAATIVLGFGAYRYGVKQFLDVGDIHNSHFERVKGNSSGIGIGIKPVAHKNSLAPVLTFSTSL